MMKHTTLRLASVTFAAATLALAACSKSEAPSPAPTASAASAPASPAAAPAAPAAPAASAPVDVCALLTQDEAKAALGADVNAGEADKPQGSLLGGCSYLSLASGKMVSVSARPAAEWQGTVDAYKDLAPVSGVGQAAQYSSKIGMLVQPAGKPYFLQVMAMPGNDQAVLTKLAQSAL